MRSGVLLFLLATLGAAIIDVSDPLAVQALYSRVSVSGRTVDALTDVLRAAGVTPDWVQRFASQIASASGLPLQAIFGLVNKLTPFGMTAPTPIVGLNSPYYGGIPAAYPDTPLASNLPQILARVRLYGTTKESFTKLIRASNLDLNLLKNNFPDFVFASGLDWKDVQDVYMTLKLGDVCSANPCPTGVCVPIDAPCPGCPSFSCVNVAMPTFPEIIPTVDPLALKQMLLRVPGDPRLLAQSLPLIAQKSGMDIVTVTTIVTDVIASTQAAAASLGAFGFPSPSPRDTILQVAAIATSPAALFDALQRVLTSLQGTVDPTPYAALIPEIASKSHLNQIQVGQVFADLTKTARGTYIAPPTIAPMNLISGAFAVGNPIGLASFSPPPSPIAATPEQLQAFVGRLTAGMDANSLQKTLTQSGIPIPQLGTLLQQIAATTKLPTPTVSGILTQLLNAAQPTPATPAPTAPPTPGQLLSVEYVISALTPEMSAASVKMALQQVKDPSTIAPFRAYIVSRTQLSPQVVDGIVNSLARSPTPSFKLPEVSFHPSSSLQVPLDTAAGPAPQTPSPSDSVFAPLSVADKQIFDSLGPTSPQALFFTLKQVSSPSLLAGYVDQIAASTQISASTVQRVIEAVVQSLNEGPPTSVSSPSLSSAVSLPPVNHVPTPPPTPIYPPTPINPPPTQAPFVPPAPVPVLNPTPFLGADNSPLAFIGTLPADGTAQDVYQALQSSSFPPTALLPYVQQIAERTGVTAGVAQSILDTITKLASPNTPSVSSTTDDFTSISASLKDGMTIEEVRAILEQQVSDPRTLSVNIQSIAFRTGLEDSAVGELVQALIKAKQQSG